MWFAYGERPTREALQRTTLDLAAQLRDQLLALGQVRPDRGTLRERVAQSLRELPQPLRHRLGGPSQPTDSDVDDSEQAA
jgi:hypothetical protein